MIDKTLLNQAILNVDSTVRDALVSLELSGLQVVIVVSDDLVLLGIITDGDIRRGFMRGYDLDARVENVMATSPLVVDVKTPRHEAVKAMIDHKIHHIPVLDSQSRLVDMYFLDDVHAKVNFNNTVVIIAGGFGKRLMPYTKDCPKPMLPINGKPMLEHILVRAIAQGFSNFVISLFYLPHVIKDYFKNGEAWNVKISYVQEESPLGTAGALSLIPEKQMHPLIVTNGDLLTNIGYKEILDHHSKIGSKATMAVRDHEIKNPFGVVNTEGFSITGFEEKPVYRSLINAGVYVLDPMALEALPTGSVCDMPTLFERLLDAGHSTAVFPMHESWLDVGRPDDLVLATNTFDRGN